MKGKKILTLVSIAAGAAIVGGTFAQWAVTDNANPFGIKISTGSTQQADVDYVTLSYGESTLLDVQNLKSGESRLAGSIVLKAETSNNAVFEGKLTVTVSQTGATAEGKDLIDYVTVDVYQDEVTQEEGQAVVLPADKDPIITLEDGKTTDTVKVKTVSADPSKPESAKTIYVVVSLDDINPDVMQAIADDIMDLKLDWNPDPDHVLSSSTIYLIDGTGTEDRYVYAWSSVDGAINKDYPGDKMEALGGGIYSYVLPTQFDRIIINRGSGDENKIVDGVEVTAAMRSTTPTCKYDADQTKWVWAEKPEALELDADYYLVGTLKGDWHPLKDYALTKVDNNHYKIEGVSLVVDEEIKVCNPARTGWFGCDSDYPGCYYKLNAGSDNLVITEAGKYTVDLYKDSANSNFLTLTKTA